MLFALRTFAILTLTLLASVAHGQNVLDMNTLPTAEGWTALDVGSGTASLAGGLLTIDTSAPATPTFLGYQAPAAAWSNSILTGNYSAEFTLRVDQDNEPGNSAVQMVLADGVRKVILAVHTDRIELAEIADSGPFTGTTEHFMDTTDDFHVYGVVVQATLVTVSVDGTPVLTVTNTGASTQNFLQFGDLLYANDTISTWDLVTFTSTDIVSEHTESWSSVKRRFD